MEQSVPLRILKMSPKNVELILRDSNNRRIVGSVDIEVSIADEAIADISEHGNEELADLILKEIQKYITYQSMRELCNNVSQSDENSDENSDEKFDNSPESTYNYLMNSHQKG